MKGLFELLLFLIIIYYILKVFSNIIHVLKSNSSGSYGRNANTEQQNNQNDITIQHSPKKKRFTKKDGEYVDYEEIK
jgi:hypothetical protein